MVRGSFSPPRTSRLIYKYAQLEKPRFRSTYFTLVGRFGRRVHHGGQRTLRLGFALDWSSPIDRSRVEEELGVLWLMKSLAEHTPHLSHHHTHTQKHAGFLPPSGQLPGYRKEYRLRGLRRSDRGQWWRSLRTFSRQGEGERPSRRPRRRPGSGFRSRARGICWRVWFFVQAPARNAMNF